MPQQLFLPAIPDPGKLEAKPVMVAVPMATAFALLPVIVTMDVLPLENDASEV
jgi:hypothetical protein